MSEVSVLNQSEEEPQLELPPGFRFHPTDEELVLHYLTPKALDRLFACAVVADVDLNKCEPWDLPGKAKMGEKEWYFFCHKDRKYPTGMRTNRATAKGYWKATGKDKEIFRGGVLVGMKKTLVFYLGRAPRGEKTSWVMHEFRLEGKLPHLLPRSAKDEWAVCRVFNKDLAAKNGQTAPATATVGLEQSNSLAFLDDFLESAELPPLMDPPFPDEVIDFNGPASTSSAMTGVQDMGNQVKMEGPVQHHQSPYYFSLPATGSGYLQQESVLPPAIRKFCKAEGSLLTPSCQTGLSNGRNTAATAAEISSAVSSRQYLELDDPIMDYTNIWKY